MVEFQTAAAPHGGYCRSSASEGVALETEFEFECLEWKDTNLPITYEFREGNDPISYGGLPKCPPTKLPAGKVDDDYKLEIVIIIKNSVGVTVAERLYIKV